MVDALDATPYSTSLKTMLPVGILAGYQTTSLDISIAFINTHLPDSHNHHENGTSIVWRLKRAMYGLRTIRDYGSYTSAEYY